MVPNWKRSYDLLLTFLLATFTVVLSDDVSSPPAVSCGSSTNTKFISDEKRLIHCLLTDSHYDPIVRPVRNVSDTLLVTLETTLVKVLDLDEKNHIMTTNAWLFHEWTDFQLQWDPNSFGGVKTIRIPIDRIWTPDIVLFNNAGDSYEYIVDKLAVVQNTGKVIWVPHAFLKSHCDLDLSRFPFDSQVCTLVFGSWTYDTSAVNVTLKNNSQVAHVMNSKEWLITRVTPKVYQWTYRNAEKYSGIVSAIEMKRTSTFYQYVFIMPTVIFAFLALLMPFVPPLSRERTILGVGLVLGCVMVLMMLENHMPTELGTVPVIAAYLAYVLVMVCVNLFFSILTINMSMRDPKHGKVPGWVRWIFLTKLNKLVCIAAEPYTAIPADIAVEESNAERELLDMRNGTSELRIPGAEGKSNVEQTMDDIRRYLRVLAARSVLGPEHSHKELVSREWHQVTRVIDRLLFLSFLLLTTVITISMYAHY